ncbi:hypothetical protein LOTGIDRAFT_170985 [Lottia gigantea]|uniref:Uncharacterized protein n=1 Tax=Lottia gigantea TaxID=225164 RepID=V4BED4_LOTGI|nr:hypothetical protein LOTGIDRAFT_170985 [Lottia gigantea]ESP04152.1 hypothetical protein LOTGIDRAFT_170985 [Lottia gigantea]
MMMESSINSATILPPYEEEFETVDNLHWSPETANSIYFFWIHQLQASTAGVKTASAKKAADAEAAATKASEEKKAAEKHRHNLVLEKLAEGKKGSGVGDMIGTMKEFEKDLVKQPRKLLNKDYIN